VTSVITNESGVMSYGMLLFGGHNVTGGVRPYAGPEAYASMIEEINSAFERADVPAIIRLQDRHFKGSTYSLRSLFRDEQREAVQRILDGTLANADTVYRSVYDELLPIMGMLEDLDLPAPEALRVADPDFDLVERLLRRAEAWRVSLGPDLPYIANQAMSEFAAALVEQPEDVAAIGRLTRLAEIASRLDGDIDLTRAQEAVYGILHSPGYEEARRRAGEGAGDARRWLDHLHALAGRLALRVEG
jgi:hypothetical protein